MRQKRNKNGTSQDETGVSNGTSKDEAGVNNGSSTDEAGITVRSAMIHLKMKPATMATFSTPTLSLTVN